MPRIIVAKLFEGIVRHALCFQFAKIERQQLFFLGPAHIAQKRAAQEIGHIHRAAAQAQRLPVHHRHGIAAARTREHHVVGPVVVMGQAARTAIAELIGFVPGGKGIADLGAFRIHAASIAFAETLP